MFIRLSLFVTSVLGGHSEFPSILPFILYASIQVRDVCLLKIFKKIFQIILFFLVINFFGSVNRFPCYLVSLELSILYKHLKQVMDNNYHPEAGSIFLSENYIDSELSKTTFYGKCLWLFYSSFFSISVISQVHTKNELIVVLKTIISKYYLFNYLNHLCTWEDVECL